MLFSIIIPCYNTEKTLQRTVESVLNQPGLNRDNCEILLVDDGSKAACSNLCDEIAEKHEIVKALHKENGGLSSARNYGIEHAQGDYLAFLDSDDWFAEDCFDAETVEKIRSEQMDMYGLRLARVSPDLKYSKASPLCDSDEVIHYRKGGFSKGYMVSYLYKRKIIVENGLSFFKLNTLEDITFLNLYANFAQTYSPIDKVMYVYWTNLNSFYHNTDDAVTFHESFRGLLLSNEFLKDKIPEAVFSDRQLVSCIAKYIPKYCACHSFRETEAFFADPIFDVMRNSEVKPWTKLQANYELWKTNPRKLWWKSRVKLGLLIAIKNSKNKKPFVELKNHIWYHYIKKVY